MLRLYKRQDKTKRTRLPAGCFQVTIRGQVILEFTLCMIVVLLMLFGATKVFHWAGRDLVERRRAHDNTLKGFSSPRQQIDPYFYTPTKMNAVWRGP